MKSDTLELRSTLLDSSHNIASGAEQGKFFLNIGKFGGGQRGGVGG